MEGPIGEEDEEEESTAEVVPEWLQTQDEAFQMMIHTTSSCMQAARMAAMVILAPIKSVSFTCMNSKLPNRSRIA
jgi:hypothetical protein